MEKNRVRVHPLLPALLCVLLLCLALSLTVRADTPLTAPTEYLFKPEKSWCYQKIGELYGADYAALYRVVLETADDYVHHRENYPEEDVTLHIHPDELRARGVHLENIDKDLANEYLQEAICFELSTVLDFALLVLDQATFNEDALWVNFAQDVTEPEMYAEMMAATTEVLTAAGLTEENLDTLSEQEKAKRIHDALSERIIYQAGMHNQQAYGGLVLKACVCAGYSRSFQWMLQQVGIPVLYVTGLSSSGHHAWNIMKLDGELWYESDLTWDDPSWGRIRYKYFAISTEDMLADHTKDQTPYWRDTPYYIPYPDCPSSITIELPVNPTNPTSQTYGLIASEGEGYRVRIYQPSGNARVFEVELEEDYLFLPDYQVTVSSGELKTTKFSDQLLYCTVSNMTEDAVISVTGVIHKPDFPEDAFITLGGEAKYGHELYVEDYRIPDDMVNPRWEWIVNESPRGSYEGADRPIGPAKFTDSSLIGCCLKVRLTADNYYGALESPLSAPVAKERVFYEGKTEVSLSAGSDERIDLSELDFRTESGKSASCSYSVPDAPEEHSCIMDYGKLGWRSSPGVYTLQVTAWETNTSLGGSCDVRLIVYPEKQRMLVRYQIHPWQTNMINLDLTYSDDGITVQKCSGKTDAAVDTQLVVAFYDADGRFLALGKADYDGSSGNFEPFTVPGVQRAAEARAFFLDPQSRPLSARGTLVLPEW